MGLDLDFLFHPRSIAVAGASADPEKRGYGFIDSLQYHGFQGPIYPVNPRGEDVLGLKGYHSLLDIEGPIDYVISSVPSSVALELLDQSSAKGAKAVHFFTARFSETGDKKAIALERELLRRAQEANIRVVGPNCMGIYCPKEGMSFMRFEKEPGHVGVLSQSGGNVHELVFSSTVRGVRFSKAVSFGNAFDVSESDLLEYFAEDPETTVIGGYLEGVRDGPRFVRALRDAAARKPVAIFKGGRTEAGTRAVASHTASLAGSRQLWEAAARQCNAVLVDSLQELSDMLVAFQHCRPVTGNRVAAIGGGGGRSVEAADTCENAGLNVAPVSAGLRAEFERRSPNFVDWISNPVDGSILSGVGLDQETIFRLMAASGDYDMFIVNAREMWSGDAKDMEQLREANDEYIQAAREIAHPLAIVQSDFVSAVPWQNEAFAENRRRAAAAGVPRFPSIGRAARALSRLARYYAVREAAEAQ